MLEEEVKFSSESGRISGFVLLVGYMLEIDFSRSSTSDSMGRPYRMNLMTSTIFDQSPPESDHVA